MTRFVCGMLCLGVIWSLIGCAEEYFYDNGCRPKSGSTLYWMLDTCSLIDNSLRECLAVCGQPVETWDVSQVTDMDEVFYSQSGFNVDIGSWDTSKVTTMTKMFYGASSFDQDLSGWCVAAIPVEPEDFAEGSALRPEHKPVWGTCP